MTEHVLTDLDAGVMTIRINRPEKKNALTADMYAVMADAIESARSDRQVKVVLLAGSEGVFTAGNDLGDFLNNPPRSGDAPVNRFISALVTAEVPLIAAVDGVAVGIGTTMLLHCDQVFVTERSRFSMPFINLALVPEAGSSLLLVETCGYRKAAELLMLGEPFNGGDALEYGIASRLCSPEDLLSEASAMARSLAAKPGAALRHTKRLLRRPPEPLPQRITAEMELFGQGLESEAAKEAFAAFFERRKPDFSRFD